MILTKAEIDKLLTKKEPIMGDKAIEEQAKGWEANVPPHVLGLVYSYMKHKYKQGETLNDMERVMGVSHDAISWAIRDLEAHGFLMVSRARKPFLYRVVK